MSLFFSSAFRVTEKYPSLIEALQRGHSRRTVLMKNVGAL